ncbi:MAG: urease subunit gamma [Nitrosarchaeum sp.]|nr:urease subunit gamma [Nitrosarchaeum sp.]
MKITILIEGEPDIKPFTKVFHYSKENEFIFFDSIKIIKNKIARNLKLNINETLAFFAASVCILLRDRKTATEIQEIMSGLLLSHQVLIGVPELMRKLTFDVNLDELPECTIVILHPISNQYSMRTSNPVM